MAHIDPTEGLPGVAPMGSCLGERLATVTDERDTARRHLARATREGTALRTRLLHTIAWSETDVRDYLDLLERGRWRAFPGGYVDEGWAERHGLPVDELPPLGERIEMFVYPHHVLGVGTVVVLGPGELNVYIERFGNVHPTCVVAWRPMLLPPWASPQLSSD